MADNAPAPEQHMPLRIAYFLHLNAGLDTGVFKKIAAQVATWRELGSVVTVFAVTRDPSVAKQLLTLGLSRPGDVTVYRRGRLAGLTDRLNAFGVVTANVLRWSPDIIYSRNDIWYPAVSRMGRAARLVIEINNDDMGEFKCQSPVHFMYNRVTRNWTYTPASGFVFVCGELATLPWFAKFGKPHLVLGNGVSLSQVSAPQGVPSRDDVRLVFIGQRDMSWHGIDKIVTMARLFPDWSFDLVGVGAEATSAPLPPNVTTWGPRLYRDYLPLLTRAHCAIGTLALHRKNMQEASPLKTREYLAHGLPVIIGYQDTDFRDGAEFLLELPNTEDSIRPNQHRIRAFVESWRDRRVSREQICHLDTKEKERVRLRFLTEVATNRTQVAVKNEQKRSIESDRQSSIPDPI